MTFDRDMPPLGARGAHAGSDVSESHLSGDAMRIQRILPSGAHYLIFAITQTGGPTYGVYSGNITINGNTNSFSGIDASNSVRVDFTT